MSKNKIFVCYWDCNGFEAIVDMTRWERDSLINTIAGKDLTLPPINVNTMLMRARFNPQRSPEMWIFNTSDDVNEDQLWDLAVQSPQLLVDMIRKNGSSLYHSAPQNNVIQ